jgi:ribose-phosphate pyrophosphokinase
MSPDAIHNEMHCLIHWPTYNKHYGDSESVLEIIQLIDNVNNFNGHLICPFLPHTIYAKHNQHKKLSAFIASLKSLAVKQITVLDAHEPLLLKKVCKENSIELINDLPICAGKALLFFLNQKLKGDFCVVAPDEGARERATSIAKYLNVPFFGFQKIRKDGKICFKGEHELVGKNILVVDDFLLTGGTLKNLNHHLNSLGVKNKYAIVTHNLTSVSTIEDLQLQYDMNIVCMNPMQDSRTGFQSLLNWLIFTAGLTS